MRALWKPFDRLDGLLFVLGVAGLVLLFLALPQQHPEAGLDATLGEDGAVAAATTFLVETGYSVDGLESHSVLMRQHELLRGLQQELGRPRAVEVLQREEPLPAYLWSVRFFEDVQGGEEQHRWYEVLLDEEGTFWQLTNSSPAAPRVSRAAARYGLLQEGGVLRENAQLPSLLTDSLLQAALAFNPEDTTWGTPEARGWSGEALVDALVRRSPRSEVKARIGPEAAAAYARYYVQQSALAGLPLQVDSTWMSSVQADAAHVRFVTREPYLGQQAEVEVSVSPAGGLLGMETRFNDVRTAGADGEGSGGTTVSIGLSADGTASFVKIFLYVVLVGVLIFVFVRRLSLHLIDVSTGVRDALLAGLMAATAVGLVVVPEMLREVPDPLVAYGIAALAVVMTGAASAVPIFFVSSASDSVARESWPEKQETLTLLRRAAVRNVPVGTALLRGLGLAAVLTGLFVLFLMLLPEAVIGVSEETSEGGYVLAEVAVPILYVGANYVVFTLFWVLSVLLGVGCLLYRWRPHALLVMGSIVLLAVLTRLSAIDVLPVGYAWALGGVLGTAVATAFWRYDVLTCIVGIIFFGLFVELAPGWLAQGLPAFMDALAAFVLAGVVGVVGVVGVMSGHSSAELPKYVPAYVTELAQQERLKRELEIAYQVQESFLPARMPQVEGVDLAAMCLAAQEVGGDYYDVVEVAPGRLGVVIGDVSGKGIQAAFFMTLVKGMWQTLARTEDEPANVLTRLNDLFCANAQRGTFVSLIYGILDVETGTFTFARAGHNPVIHKRSVDREAAFIRPSGMAIGLAAGDLFWESVEQVTLSLRRGDVLVFYTDGFSEAMNTVHEQFGDDRIARRVERAGSGSARSILEAVSSDVARFAEAAERHDDMTMIVMKMGAMTSHHDGAASRRGENGAEPARGLERENVVG